MSDSELWGSGNGRKTPLPESLTDLFSRFMRGELSKEEYTRRALAIVHPDKGEGIETDS